MKLSKNVETLSLTDRREIVLFRIKVIVPLKSARIRFESLKVYQSVQTMQKKTSDL